MAHACNPGTSEAEGGAKDSAQFETDLVCLASFDTKLRTNGERAVGGKGGGRIKRGRRQREGRRREEERGGWRREWVERGRWMEKMRKRN